MEREILQSYGENDNKSSTTSSPHFSQTMDFINTFSPSKFSDEDGGGATENRLYQASVVLEYQQLYNRYAMCLAHLQDSVKEVDDLRMENDELRIANTALVRRLSMLSQATIQNCFLSSAARPPVPILNEFRALELAGGGGGGFDGRVAGEVSPTSVIERNRVERRGGDERVTLPKSISVRSSGYLKMNQRGGGAGVGGGDRGGSSRSAASGRRVSRSPVPNESQRMYVPRGKREEADMELEVYNQGMQKTELCNKWQETGACPYGDECQFAHGIKELRPVIRHPRYKTEVCRMVLVGGSCPYGHRCHFRHSLTDQEKLMAQYH